MFAGKSWLSLGWWADGRNAQKIKRARLPVRALLNFLDELASLTNRVGGGPKNIRAKQKFWLFLASAAKACIAIR
jgi:hypothetical protein